MKKVILVLLAVLLVAGVVAVVPAKAHAAPASKATATARTYDPIVGTWYKGKYWFRVREPNYNGIYRVSWSNGSGPKIRYKIAMSSEGVYYELANNANTYTVAADAQSVWVHYKTTSGRYITRRFWRVT